MQKITPMLWFDTQAEEAAKFYTSIFDNSKIRRVVPYGDGGPGPKGTPMVVDFEINGERFTALNGGPQFKFTEAISLVVHCASQEEVDRYWEKLTAGGGQPGPCGWLKDRYGLSWQVVPDAVIELLSKPGKTSERAMSAVMQMGKIDIAAVQRAVAV